MIQRFDGPGGIAAGLWQMYHNLNKISENLKVEEGSVEALGVKLTTLKRIRPTTIAGIT